VWQIASDYVVIICKQLYISH